MMLFLSNNWLIDLCLHMSRDARKLVFGVSDQVQHKLVYAVTEDGYRLEILDKERRGIVVICGA